MGPAWALPALWAAAMANGPGGVALTRQCTIMVKGHQGPGRILTESRGFLGAVETKTHGEILGGVPRNGPNLPLPTCLTKQCFGGGALEFGRKLEKTPPLDSQRVPATPPPIPIHSRTHHRMVGGNFRWLE